MTVEWTFLGIGAGSFSVAGHPFGNMTPFDTSTDNSTSVAKPGTSLPAILMNDR